MSDFHEHGFVKVIAVKKVGSSTLNRAFREQTFEENRVPHFVTMVRHPGARLVSCWNHFHKVRAPQHNGEVRENIGLPALPFYPWCEEVLRRDVLTLDQHVRPQAPEIYDRIEHAPKGSRIFIGQLEQANAKNAALVRYLGRSVTLEEKRRHYHMPWVTFYDKRLLESVRRRFKADMMLWNALVSDGYWQNTGTRKISDDLHFAYNFW